MSVVEYIVGDGGVNEAPAPAFSESACGFLASLSAWLRADREARRFSDVQSFAFWCRKGNVSKEAERMRERGRRFGRGLAFHVTPSNVPVNFAYSFAFSLLAGNANVVRLPSRPFPQVEIICRGVRSVMGEYPDVAARTAFVRYDSAGEATREFSLASDVRIVWGGDRTVSSIRALPTKPRCVDVTFPDRYSVAVVDGPAVEALSEEALEELARAFYNDTYLMDQNACSSPRVVLWLRAEERAKQRFWEAVASYAAPRYDLQPVSAMDKFDLSCRDAIEFEGHARIERFGNVLYRAILDDVPAGRLEACDLRGDSGYFYDCDLPGLDDLARFVGERYQTISYFGIDAHAVLECVGRFGLKGVDRVVPFGKAIDMRPVWDGYELFYTLSRIIDVE